MTSTEVHANKVVGAPESTLPYLPIQTPSSEVYKQWPGRLNFLPIFLLPGSASIACYFHLSIQVSRAPGQKYHQQPQQPSTQLQPKAQSTTKRATKALHIIDLDTNKPLDLDESSSSTSHETASATRSIEESRREGFMAKTSGKLNILRDSSQTGHSEYSASPSQLVMPRATIAPFLADSTSSKGLSRFATYTAYTNPLANTGCAAQILWKIEHENNGMESVHIIV